MVLAWGFRPSRCLSFVHISLLPYSPFELVLSENFLVLSFWIYLV